MTEDVVDQLVTNIDIADAIVADLVGIQEDLPDVNELLLNVTELLNKTKDLIVAHSNETIAIIATMNKNNREADILSINDYDM